MKVALAQDFDCVEKRQIGGAVQPTANLEFVRTRRLEFELGRHTCANLI